MRVRLLKKNIKGARERERVEIYTTLAGNRERERKTVRKRCSIVIREL